MKLSKLIEELQRIEDSEKKNGDSYVDMDIVVVVNGFRYSKVDITGVKRGIDWYQGKLILTTEEQLQVVPKRLK